MVTLELAWDEGTMACKFISTLPVDVVCTFALADDLTTDLVPLSSLVAAFLFLLTVVFVVSVYSV